jgi:hypothetical protein
VDIEAFLTAFLDSQQTSRILRLENNELRGRIQRLDDQLEEARMLARRCQTTHADLPIPQSRSLDSRSRANSTDDGRLPHSSFCSSPFSVPFVIQTPPLPSLNQDRDLPTQAPSAKGVAEHACVGFYGYVSILTFFSCSSVVDTSHSSIPRSVTR